MDCFEPPDRQVIGGFLVPRSHGEVELLSGGIVSRIALILFALFLPFSTHAATCNAGYYLENGVCVGCDRVGDYCPGDDSKYACPDSQIISSNDIDIVSTRILSWGCGSNNATGLDCCVKTGNWTSNGGYGYYSRYYNQSSNAYTGGLTLYTYAYTGYYMSRAYSDSDGYWYDVKPCTNAPA